MYICFPNYAKMQVIYLSTFLLQIATLCISCCTYFLLTCKKKMSSTALQSALDQLTLYPMLNKLSWDWFWFWCFPQNEFQSWDAQTAEGPISSKGTNHLISPFLWFFDTTLPNLSEYILFYVYLLETILLYKLNFWWRYERLNQVNKKFDAVSTGWSNQFCFLLWVHDFFFKDLLIWSHL